MVKSINIYSFTKNYFSTYLYAGHYAITGNVVGNMKNDSSLTKFIVNWRNQGWGTPCYKKSSPQN